MVLLENCYWWRFPKVSFCIFCVIFLGWISLYNFRRLFKKEPKIASWHEIKPRVFEKQFFDISSVQYFNLVVLNRFLNSNSYLQCLIPKALGFWFTMIFDEKQQKITKNHQNDAISRKMMTNQNPKAFGIQDEILIWHQRNSLREVTVGRSGG